jgi:NADPH:quinone reductase-like Zn-dependent oxidoreductase
MKAVVYYQYGPPDVLQVAEIENPTPNENQILIKVHAASINAADYRPLSGKPFPIRLMIGGLLRPKNPRIGIDVAGQVEAVGANVKRFRTGDEVFGCANGAFAEYVLAREKNLALKPANRSFEEAAAVPVAALTALQGFRYVGVIRPGQKVLIQGASGGVGIFAVQMAKMYGAEVTAVCSTRNLDMVRSIGADHVIDYRREDFTQNGKEYDLIFAINGYHPAFRLQALLDSPGHVRLRGWHFPAAFPGHAFGKVYVEEGWEDTGQYGDIYDQPGRYRSTGKTSARGQNLPSD